VRQWLRSLEDRLSSAIRLLSSLDPSSVLKRGYAIVRDEAGKGISSVVQLTRGRSIRLTLRDGEAGAVIERLSQTAQQRLL